MATNGGGGAGKTIAWVGGAVLVLILLCCGGMAWTGKPFFDFGKNLAQMNNDLQNEHSASLVEGEQQTRLQITVLPGVTGQDFYAVGIVPDVDALSAEEITALQDEVWDRWCTAFAEGGAMPVHGVGIGTQGGPNGVHGWQDHTAPIDEVIERTGTPAPDSGWFAKFMPAPTNDAIKVDIKIDPVEVDAPEDTPVDEPGSGE